MNRYLLPVAILEGLAVVVLAVLLATRSDPPPSPRHVPDDAAAAGADRAAASWSAPIAVGATESLATPARHEVDAAAPGGRAYDAARGTLLHGRIVGPDGAPVAGAQVRARRDGQTRGISAGVHDERGYAIPGLDPGPWIVSCDAEGFRSSTTEVEVQAVATQQLDLRLERSHVVLVAFVDETGAPAAERWAAAKLTFGWRVSAVATAEEPPSAFPMTTYGSSHGIGIGTWHTRMHGDDLPDRFAGKLEIDAPGPVWVAAVLRQHVVGKVLVAPEQTEVDVPIRTADAIAVLGTVRARIVAAESGAPLEGARLSVSDRQSGGVGQPADADGVVVVERAIPGIVEVAANAPDREHYHCMVRLAAGGDVDLGTIRLGPPRRIAGTVRGPDGEKLAGVTFRWFHLDRATPDVPLDNGFSARSNTEGAFALFGTGAGRYLVRASHERGAAALVVDSTSGDAANLDLRLEPGVPVTIENRVPPTSTFLVNLTDERGVRIESWLERPLPKLRTREKVLPPGRYVVEIRNDSGVVRTERIDARRTGARLVVP